MPVYRPDPAGVFSSDVHRRVLAALPTEAGVDAAYALEPVLADENIPLYVRDQDTLHDFARILAELEGSGYADLTEGWVRRTPAGTKALDADVAYEVLPKLTDEEIAEREAANVELLASAKSRAAQSRIAANEAAQKEIEKSIAADEAVIAEAQAILAEDQA